MLETGRQHLHFSVCCYKTLNYMVLYTDSLKLWRSQNNMAEEKRCANILAWLIINDGNGK